jgi:hypothetical protein
MKKNPRLGSSLDDLLKKDGTLEEVEAKAIKRVFAWQLEEARKRRHLTKVQMAAKMRTSRAALDRLLDPDNPAATLNQMARAAAVVGKRLEIGLGD